MVPHICDFRVFGGPPKIRFYTEKVTKKGPLEFSRFFCFARGPFWQLLGLPGVALGGPLGLRGSLGTSSGVPWVSFGDPWGSSGDPWAPLSDPRGPLRSSLGENPGEEATNSVPSCASGPGRKSTYTQLREGQTGIRATEEGLDREVLIPSLDRYIVFHS